MMNRHSEHGIKSREDRDIHPQRPKYPTVAKVYVAPKEIMDEVNETHPDYKPRKRKEEKKP